MQPHEVPNPPAFSEEERWRLYEYGKRKLLDEQTRLFPHRTPREHEQEIRRLLDELEL